MTVLLAVLGWLLVAPLLTLGTARFLRQASMQSAGPWAAAETAGAARANAGVEVPAPRTPLTVREDSSPRR